MEKIASYIIEEPEMSQKMEFLYYLKKRVDIFYDNSVILKSVLAELFINKTNINDIDKNTLLTASLLYSCKKKENPQTREEIDGYPKKSIEFLEDMGFDKDFCKICIEHNRYVDMGPRSKEGDILELVDQFGGMILHRPERRGFPVDEAMCLLEYRNLKNVNNQYLPQFKQFIDDMEQVKIVESLKENGAISKLRELYNSIPRDNIVKGIRAREEYINVLPGYNKDAADISSEEKIEAEER